MTMASANTDPTWSRDEAADANPDLTRKRQRLSEETETSPLSNDDDVVIEALPPDEVGNSFENAIALDDDSAMPPASETFILAPDVNMTPAEQLNWLCGQAPSALPVDGVVFRALCSWLAEHLYVTRDHVDLILDSYIDEHEFFGKLGQACYAILERQDDLFEPKELQRHGFGALTELVNSFLDALFELSLRVLRILPSIVDSTIARRDSGQVSKTRQHLDLLYYVLILAQTLAYYRANQIVGFFSANLGFKPVAQGKRRKAEFCQQLEPSMHLLELLKKLAQNHREITNAWDGIDAILRIFLTVGLPSDAEERTVMDLAHLYILPVICEKHPRALPDGFHELAIKSSTFFLTRLANPADTSESATLYESYIKSETDALMMESTHDAGVAESLQNVSGGDHATLVELLTTAWTLARLKSFIYSDIMDVRSCGITLLSQKLLELYNAHRTGHDNFEHPVLQYVARFMRANELTKYIFGPNSHASLVNHSQNIIGFLAATFAYTNLESDIIWHACTNSVETEFVKASFTVLADLCRYLDLDHLLYLANKYAVTPPSKLGKDAVESLTDLFQRVQIKSGELNDHKHRLATAFISMDIMMRVPNVHDQTPLLQLRNTARTELGRFASPAYSKDERAQIFSRCIPNLLNANEHATTSVEIIAMFLPWIQSSQEAQELLDMLPIQAVVDELSQYVTSRREVEGREQTVTGVSGLQTRLDFIVRLMSLPGTVIDEQVYASLFRYTVGDMGLNNDAREHCWISLMDFCSIGELCKVSTALIAHFLEKEAFQLDLQFMTPRLIHLFGVSLRNQVSKNATSDGDIHMLEAPTWQKLVQAAESVGASQVSQPATTVICDLLFQQLRQSEEDSRVTAIQCHADFARQQISRICEDFADLEIVGTAPICQKISLLDAVLRRSRQSAPSFSPLQDTDICLATQPADELFKCMVQVYGGGQLQPKQYRLQANNTTTVSELQARLPSITGATENRIIVGGKALDSDSQSTEPIAQLGVQTSGGILISPKHTMNSDLAIILTSPGTVEQEVLTHFDDLERLLDGPDDVAQKAHHFLSTIPPPTQARQKVASPTTAVQDLFPIGKHAWRGTYSLHILNVHREDFAKIGVADDEFILQGVRLLLAVLVDSNRPLHNTIFTNVLAALTEFLQERPSNASEATGIEEPSAFIDRLIDICNFAVQYPRQIDENRSPLLIEALRTLFQASRMDNSIWKCFIGNPRAAEMHKNILLLCPERCFPPSALTLIKDFCVEERQPDNVADFYATTLLGLLPEALIHRHRATQFFVLAIDAIMSSRALDSNEAKARETMDFLISTLRRYQHIESVDLPIVDHAMLGLLRLLAEVIQIVKCFKKALGLSNLCTEILTRFLFPPYDDPLARPLVDTSTRDWAYKLVQGTCESEADFASLLDVTVIAMKDSSGNPHDKFPGAASWLRPAPKCSGLPNLGMTCYMNSLLQQLFANVHFRKFIFEVPIFDSEKQALVMEVQKLFANMQDSYCGSPDTSELAKVLNIQTDSQEDVHGFYEDLLARLEANMPNAMWKAALNRFYKGKQLSQIKGDCGHVSPKTEPFVDLPIIIKNKIGLQESLDEFVQGEPMEGANQYKCQACDSADGGRLVNAVRRACPEEIPDNLTFCLKRFTFEAMLGVEGKVNDRFEFPQTIDMAPYKAAHLSDPTSKVEEDNFELVGVIVHQGTLHLGHYWSYSLLRNTAQPFSRTWVKLEDRNVSLVQNGIHEVQQECFGGQRYNNGNERADNAYVLFYERRSSLEETIALPGPVVDPLTHLLLPPKVAPPTRLAKETHIGNAWRFRIAHLYHEDFAAFVGWLLEHYRDDSKDQRLAGRKPAASAESGVSSDTEGSAASLASDEELAADPLLQKVSEVAMTFLQRIAVSDAAPGRRLAQCTSLLSSLLQAQPDFAVLFVNHVITAQKWFEQIVLHDNKRVRSLIGDFVIFCLKQIKDHDQAFYERAFRSLIETHSEPTKIAARAPLLDWEDYLKFAASLASLGQDKTEIVLDSGYWHWAFDLLYLPVDGSLRKKYPGVAEHFKTNPSKVSALYEFIYSILSTNVDLLTSLTHPELEGYHSEGPDGLVLAEDEMDRLEDQPTTGNRQGIFHWIRASRWAKHDCPWQDNAPGKLVGLLCSVKSSRQTMIQIHQCLLRHIDIEEEHLSTLVSLAMHFCTSCGSEEHALPIFQTLTKVMPMWEGSNGELLKVLPDTYNAVPRTVISTMESWTPTFLGAKQMLRDEVAKWLQEKVFVNPLSDSPDLDAERARQARKLIKSCDVYLRDACNKDRPRSRFEATIQLVYTVGTYLQTLQAELASLAESAEYEVNIKLRTEVDEIPQTMVVLKDLETDIFSLWQPDVVGTMQGTSQQDVRASVEASEDFTSGDDWDDDDDESVTLD